MPTAVNMRQASLSFSGNASNTTNLTVPLTGTGVAVVVAGGTEPPILNASINGGTAQGAVLAFNKKVVNFGKVARNAKKELKIKVRNIGNAVVKPTFVLNGKGFKKVSTNCGNLAVNRSCDVIIRFKAPGKKGAAKGTLSAMANGMPNTVTVELTAAAK